MNARGPAPVGVASRATLVALPKPGSKPNEAGMYHRAFSAFKLFLDPSDPRRISSLPRPVRPWRTRRGGSDHPFAAPSASRSAAARSDDSQV